MARAKPKADREQWEIGQAVIAAWFKVLPDSTAGTVGDVESLRDELTTALKEILEPPPVFDLHIDPYDRSKIHIVVPQVPENIKTRTELVDYLTRHHHSSGRHYHEDMGMALLFGCGK